MLWGLGAALVAASLFGAGSIAQAMGSREVPTAAGFSPGFVIGLLRQPMFLLAIALNLTGFAFHLIALRTIPLFLAQSAIAASLAFTALLAVIVFGDHLGRRDWLAIAAVTGGLALMAASAGSVGETAVSDAFVLGLFVAIAVVAMLGAVASRLPHAVGTEVLGLLAGLGFAGVGISARTLPDLGASTLLSSAETYALLLSGGLAFLLYSLALQRGTVTGATAPMIVTQTITPAVVGLLLLDDEIRSGWFPLAVIGFLVTGAGALALARFEGAVDHAS